MKQHTTTEHTVHQEVALLLPWYVNGTLGGSERVRVEQHVRNCIHCRRELAVESATLELFRRDDALDQSASTGFEHLRSRIAAAGTDRPAGLTRTAQRRDNLLGQLYRLWNGTYGRQLLVTASLALVVVVAGLTWVLPGLEHAGDVRGTARTGYETLSTAQLAAANANDLHVIFSPGVSPELIAGLLESLPAQVVDGPDEAGVYTVRLLNVSRADDRRVAIADLRGRPGVLFVEAAQPLALTRPAPGHSP